VEIVPDLVASSRASAPQAGVADRVEFREQDLFATDLSASTVITMYLLPEVNLQLRPRLLALPAGTRIVSHDWDMGDWAPDRTLTWTCPTRPSAARSAAGCTCGWCRPGCTACGAAARRADAAVIAPGPAPTVAGLHGPGRSLPCIMQLADRATGHVRNPEDASFSGLRCGLQTSWNPALNSARNPSSSICMGLFRQFIKLHEAIVFALPSMRMPVPISPGHVDDSTNQETPCNTICDCLARHCAAPCPPCC
jgi:hypothetical protein